MFTSLAPSPIARVVHLFLRISQTMSCFCLGVTRQQITALHLLTRRTRVCSSTVPRRLSPVAMRQAYREGGSWSRCSTTSWRVVFQSTTAISVESSPQESAMLMAVSFLSPVSIHTFTPAARMASMVGLTLSCSWSSMAVAPMSSSYRYSISSIYRALPVAYSLRRSKCFSMKSFCLSLRTELSLSNLWRMTSGDYVSRSAGKESSSMIMRVTPSMPLPLPTLFSSISKRAILRSSSSFTFFFSLCSTFSSLEREDA